MKDERQTGQTGVTVFIMAQTAIVRAGLESLVNSDHRFVMAGSSAVNLSSALDPAFLFDHPPDIVLLDIAHQGDFDALIKFLSKENEVFPAVILLLAEELQNRQLTSKTLKSGVVRGILSREAAAEEIGAAIVAAAENLFVASPEILELLLSGANSRDDFSFASENYLSSNPKLSLQSESLTPREKEILEMLAEGISNKLIAYRLNISEHTVKFHVSSIFAKLDVTTRTEAVTESLRRGLILL
ncbi:MAG: response regulator transcription factor [Pyrinomonadaceae bacterium]